MASPKKPTAPTKPGLPTKPKKPAGLPTKPAEAPKDERPFTAGDVQVAVNRTLFSVAVTALAQGLVFLAECPGRVEGGRCRLLRGHDGKCLPVRPAASLLLPKKGG